MESTGFELTTYHGSILGSRPTSSPVCASKQSSVFLDCDSSSLFLFCFLRVLAIFLLDPSARLPQKSRQQFPSLPQARPEGLKGTASVTPIYPTWNETSQCGIDLTFLGGLPGACEVLPTIDAPGKKKNNLPGQGRVLLRQRTQGDS